MTTHRGAREIDIALQTGGSFERRKRFCSDNMKCKPTMLSNRPERNGKGVE